jgi:hypothetical protein
MPEEKKIPPIEAPKKSSPSKSDPQPKGADPQPRNETRMTELFPIQKDGQTIEEWLKEKPSGTSGIYSMLRQLMSGYTGGS